MDERTLAIAQWRIALEDTFGGVRGDVGTVIQSLYAGECQNKQFTIAKCEGFMTLMQSFFDFAIRTFAEARAHAVILNAYNVAYNLAALRRMRVGNLAFERGYYLDAASQLRAVFENTLYVGAVLRGLCWFNELHSFAGAVDLSKITPDALLRKLHQHAKAVNQRVARLMYGEDSLLDPEDQAKIRLELTMQHMHVHRGDSNVVCFIAEMMQDEKMPGIAPEFDVEYARIYASTAACAAWSQLRILQYLAEPKTNSPTWREQWSVLDDAFRFWVAGWESPFAGPFLRLMDTSFTFDPEVAIRQLRKTQPGVHTS